MPFMSAFDYLTKTADITPIFVKKALMRGVAAAIKETRPGGLRVTGALLVTTPTRDVRWPHAGADDPLLVVPRRGPGVYVRQLKACAALRIKEALIRSAIKGTRSLIYPTLNGALF